MENICRIPTAHGVFQHKVDDAELGYVVDMDSAGTHNFYLGSLYRWLFKVALDWAPRHFIIVPSVRSQTFG